MDDPRSCRRPDDVDDAAAGLDETDSFGDVTCPKDGVGPGILPSVDAPTGLISALFTGLVIGVLGRLIIPGRQAIGCLLTILIGLLGAALGLVVARAADAGWLLTLLLQVAVAAVLVLVISTITGRDAP